jgi:hypothetical protein
MEKLKIKFVREYTVKDGTGTRYEKGQVVELSAASANHFISRRAAVVAPQGYRKAKSEP